MNLRPTLVIVLALTAFGHLPLSAQSAGAAKANQAAYDAYGSGDYQTAAKAYEQLIKDYPTDAVIPAANVQLGFSYYFLGEYDKAQAIVEKALRDPAIPPDLKPIAASFLPQVLSSKAAALPPGDAKRKPAFEQAIKEFGNFVQQYPTSPQVESMIYGRALASYQIEAYDDAVKDLESNMTKFASSPSVLDSQNLLALTLATQASRAISKPGADPTQPMALFKRSTDLLGDIIQKKTDLTLVNDAQFQLGEILFNMAAFSPENERAPLYDKAMQAYREVLPNDEMVTLQKEKMATIPDRRRQLIMQRATPAQIQALDAQLEREQRKLAELQARPDQIATAMLKMGEIYYNRSTPDQPLYNQARVVLNHVQQFLQNEEDKKRALYFLTMTYAIQNVATSAAERYEQFQAAYKGDPLAENLPLALGNAYLLQTPPDAPAAIKYFDESLQLYPKGPLVNATVVAKAQAQVQLQQFADAEATFTQFLATNPDPTLAVGAQMGLANIYKMQGLWDKALPAYQAVVAKYPNTPQSKDAEFWIAVASQQKGDDAGAIPQFQKFIAGSPDNALVPTALYQLAEAQIKTGAGDAGVATFAELANKFPKSQPAPYTYFARAKIYLEQQKPDEVDKLMREFIEKYPQDEKVFFAFDQMAANRLAAQDTPGALKIYAEVVEKYPDNPNSPIALRKSGELPLNQAGTMGRFGAMSTEEQGVWKNLMESSIAANEQLLAKYPDSDELATGLVNLLKAQRMLAAAGLKPAPGIQTYFESLAQNAASNAAKSKIQFAIANFESEKSKEASLKRMDEAFQQSVKYSPEDLDFYGTLLIENKKFDQAQAVYQKVAADYALNPAIPKEQTPLLTQQAQAIALFGQGKVAQERGQGAEAAQFFQQLKTLYPWSPKVVEADYGIAENDFKTGKLDEALAKLPIIIRVQTATADLRAKAMFLIGQIFLKKSEAATDPKQKADDLATAVDNIAKINQLFPNTSVSAESLWTGGQLFELQIAASTDPAFKQRQTKLAILSYQDLVRDYPNSPFAAKAQERLTALGAK